MNWLETETGKQMLSGYLTQFKGKASQAVYRSDISQFFDFFNDDPARLSDAAFHAYKEKIGNSVSAGTLKRKFSAINRFLKFLESNLTGFKSPLGQSHGDLQKFQAADYSESDLFRRHLDQWVPRNCTDATIKLYKMHVRLFFGWVKKGGRDLHETDFLKYKEYLTTEEMKDSTIWIKFIAINGFFNHLAKYAKIKKPYVFKELGLIMPKPDKGYYSLIERDEITRLYSVIDRSELIGKRDYAILRLMLGYALRVNEVCRFRFRDIGERYKNKLKVWILIGRVISGTVRILPSSLRVNLWRRLMIISNHPAFVLNRIQGYSCRLFGIFMKDA